MATIRASWKRTVQVKPYESETLELSVEQDGVEYETERLIMAVQDMDRTLAAAGDALIMERLALREVVPQEIARVRRPARPEPAPDSKVIEMVKKDAPVADPEEPDEYLSAQ